MKIPSMTRRDFVRLGAGAAVAGAAVKSTLLEPLALAAETGRRIRFAIVGTGIRGCDLLRSARKVPTGVCVGAADLYVTRHRRRQRGIRRGYSHHRRLPLAAGPQGCGRDPDCHIGPSSPPRDAGRRCGRQGRVLRKAHVAQRRRRAGHGARRCSRTSASSRPAASASAPFSTKGSGDLRIGTTGRGALDRCALEPQLAGRGMGLPHCAATPARRRSTGRHFCVDAPERPFDPLRFFRWRCFADYGSGLGGDLFVHLSRHSASPGSMPPASRAYSSGGLYSLQRRARFS